MKTVKDFTKDLHTKSVKELIDMLSVYQKGLYELKMKNAVRALTQTHLISRQRKDVARIKTILAAKIK